MVVDTPHPVVVKKTHWGELVEFDVLIYPLLESLWARDIFTRWSCQGDVRPKPRRLRDFSYVQCIGSDEIDSVVELFTSDPVFGESVLIHGDYDSEWAVLRRTLALRSNVLRSSLIVEKDNGRLGEGIPRVCIRFPSTKLAAAVELLETR